MQSILIALVFSTPLIPIEVMDYPYSDDPVYLVYEESGSGHRISLSLDFEVMNNPLTDFVDYPGMFNPAKAAASFDAGERILSVYSQYPGSANYYLATYRLDDDGGLSLLESGGHDYYYDALERIRLNVDSLDLDEALSNAWSVMYPQSNHYSREMCILLLKAGLQHADSLIDGGESPENAMECFQEINDVVWNLSGNDVHMVVQALETYPEGISVSPENYLTMLDKYADLLEDAGDSDGSENVRQVIRELAGD